MKVLQHKFRPRDSDDWCECGRPEVDRAHPHEPIPDKFIIDWCRCGMPTKWHDEP